MTTPTQGEHAQPWRSAVLDLIDECPGLALEQDRWLSRRVKELDFPSAPAQPAAPQGGAYAPMQGLSAYLRAESVGVQGVAAETLRQWAAEVDVASAHALRASHGQAPAAGVELLSAAISCRDANQALLNAQAATLNGKSVPIPEAWAAPFEAALQAQARLYAAIEAMPTSSPTAQPAPAANYDHGPQSTIVEEAARHVGKWLNERPNRPLDLRDVAMLVAHAQAPAAGAVVGSSLRDEIQRLARFADQATRMGLRDMHNNLETLAEELTKLIAAPTPAAQRGDAT